MMFKTMVFGGCLLGLTFLGLGTAAHANNVSAAREGGLIKIFGDAAANQIVVSQNLAGDLLVSGKNGTTVNGKAQVWFRNFELLAMEIRMAGGNDLVTVSRLNVPIDLFVDLGAGNDRLVTGAIPSTIGANLTIEGGLGNDIVRLTGWTVHGDLYINGQAGALTAELTGLSVGFNLTVIGDSAIDKVTVAMSTVGDTTSIETKGGADQVTVTDFAGFDLAINTDQGADVVTLINVVTLEDIGVFTGTQNDQVSFEDVFSGKNIKVTLDVGHDWFSGTNVWAEYDAVFEGGDGTDTFVDMGVEGGEKTEIKEFEIFL